jgi:hypothetical protein
MAAEANPSLFHHHVAVTLARQAALKQIKQQRKRLGLRETLPMSVLSRMAIDLVKANPAFLAEAALRPVVQELQHPHRKRRPDPKQELLCRNQVQNGGQQ